MNIGKQIKDAFADNKYLLLISAIIFIVSLLLGFLLEPYLYSIFNPVVNKMQEDLASGAISVTFQSIFTNNILIVFRMFIFGILLCFSAVILSYNGFFLGYFLASHGDLIRNIVFIVPHGIFELPSIVIATTSGLVLFKFIFKFIKDVYKNKISAYNSLEKNYLILKQSLIILAIACILMFIAGIIESYFTIPIATWILGL